MIPALFAVVACPKAPPGPEAPPATPPPAAPGVAGAAADPLVPPLKETDVVAMVKGQPILAKEIMDKIKGQETKALADHAKKIYEIRETAIRSLVLDQLLTEAAKKEGVDGIEAYLRKQVEARKKPADEKRLKELYDRLVPGGNPPFEQVKPQVAQALEQQEARETLESIMDEVLAANQVKWMLKEPALPRMDVSVDDDPVLGNPGAKVTIIAFSDFECPYCSQAAQAMHDLVKKYDGKVRVAFRDFPLSFHKSARRAAMAGGCAHAQGKFWPFHDQMFKNQQALEEKALKTYARVAGLDGEKFDKCLADGTYDKEVDKDMADGQAAGVEGTPTFFINGRPHTGGLSVEELSKAVDAALAEAG